MIDLIGNKSQIEFERQGDVLVLNTSQLKNGMYFLVLSDGEEQLTEKILIEN